MFIKYIFSEIASVTDVLTSEKYFHTSIKKEAVGKTETSACCVPRKLSEAEA